MRSPILSSPTDIGKIEPRVGGMNMGFGEAEFAAHEINKSSLAPTRLSRLRYPGTDRRRDTFHLTHQEIPLNFGYDRSGIAALREGKVI